MSRLLSVITVASAFCAAACGSSAIASNSSPSPSPNAAANQFRNGASGQLVQINGQTLILTGPNGDTTVAYGSSTTFSKTSTAMLADIVPGTCVVAAGQKDATGMLIATTVRITPMTSTGCAPPRTAAPSPNPSVSPRPTPSTQANFSVVSGQVTAASGTSIKVQTTTSGNQTITVPTTSSVTANAAASASDLQTGECIRANGGKDSSGTVQATSITITPPGPSGTCTSGGFGRRGSSSPSASTSNG